MRERTVTFEGTDASATIHSVGDGQKGTDFVVVISADGHDITARTVDFQHANELLDCLSKCAGLDY